MQGPHEPGFTPGGESLGDPAASFREIVHALKPGGVFLAIDHIAPHGAGLDAGGMLQRVEERVTTTMAESAGLRSDLLKNADDPLTNSVFAPEVQGKTSQFMMLYQKWGSATAFAWSAVGGTTPPD
ncbi:MAG: hypothetical protein Q8L60_11345 [Gammaproteobacteria bacterium]|nr:hypothetical protein [Gammaproteobacteria bacterium]MDP2139826.1 hypothetical protein [Gammaproteobacteria bacterium]MDP2347066.1 hypothetical protein [Gammaproteobacteria bacterium]